MAKIGKKGGSITITIPSEIAKVKGWDEKDKLILAFFTTTPIAKVDSNTPVIVVEAMEKIKK